MTFNEHFQHQVDSANCEFLPDDIKDGVMSDFRVMSQLGIDNDGDQNRFFLVRNHVPEIVHSIFKLKLSDNAARAIAAEVFRNREKAPIGTLLELIEATDLALKKMVPGNLIPKVAYPQPGSIAELPQYDIGRWVAATREIYGLMNKGQESRQAKQSVIGNWEAKEKMDYEQWLKFYKERTPEKYPKLAQDNSDGLFLANMPIGVNSLRARNHKVPNPIGGMRAEIPGLPQPDVNPARDKIEGQRKKLISRLNSAEKMLASLDGQFFAGDDQELMLKLLQDLKRRIQTANKLTSKSSLFVDHIYRAANYLEAKGRNNAAGFFYKLAQMDPMGGLGMPPLPGGDDQLPGAEPTPAEGNLDDTYECLKEFFDNLKRGISDKDDTPEERKDAKKAPPVAAIPPIPAAPPPPVAAAIEIEETIKIGTGYWHPRFKFAQEPPPPPPLVDEAPIEVEAPPTDVEAPKAETPEDNTEDVIDAALKGVTIEDVVKRLDMLVSIYNKREIARQLSILDIMMDRIGLSSFFPALGEAMSKALESNQYIGSRLEGVLTRLKGSMNVPGASEWISPPTVEMNPETTGIRNDLQKKKDEDEQRKELRKQQDIAKLQGGAAGPDVGPAAAPPGASVDLQQPVSKIERAPKIDVR
ncbi:hypothetical protein M0R72_02085 [Candidatus Pacearchaeota archaeon]|jgi:hypothetical protein|nr:hypothetical protein [Candidatus Pacearchaeota archaeon]